MEELPIDIHYNKLSDWLLKRRHCKQNWQDAALVIREKINNAIQDMPAHDDITSLLSGTYINYFHCLRIVEILRETEASSRNIFGSYSSQRMKDWQEIIRLYETDLVNLAEAAQMLARNVNYEVPFLKRQVAKCKKTQQECIRKEADYNSLAAELKAKYADTCKAIGVEGKHVKRELLALAAGLPTTYEKFTSRCRELIPCLDYYAKFCSFVNSSEEASVCPLLRALTTKGNITTYEWRTGRRPESVIESALQLSDASWMDEAKGDSGTVDGEIDWGAIDFGDDGEGNSAEVQSDEQLNIEVNDEGNAELSVDWGDDPTPLKVADHGENVARGKDALTILDNPTTRFQFQDEIGELDGFLQERLTESSGKSDVIMISIFQSAPPSIQINDSQLTAMLSLISAISAEFSSARLQQLMLIRSSPRYVERLTESICKILDQSEKMAASARLMALRRQEAHDEQLQTEPKIDLVKTKTMELKKQVEREISKKYKDRLVNIMGEINAM